MGQRKGPRRNAATRLRLYQREMASLGRVFDEWRPHMKPGAYALEGRVAWRRGSRRHIPLLGSAAQRPGLHPVRLGKRLAGLHRGRLVAAEPDAVPPFSVLVDAQRKTLLLDEAEGQVLHSHRHERSFRSHTGRPRTLLRHLPPPELLEIRPGRIVLERLVEGTDRDEWSDRDREAAEGHVWESVTSYLAAANADSVTGEEAMHQSVGRLACDPHLDCVGTRIKRIFGLEGPGPLVPVFHQHGDLRLANMRLNGDGFVVLDWEHSRPLPFYFDLLHWMYMEWVYHGDIRPLKTYFSGGYDDRIAEAFDAAGMDFRPSERQQWFGSYLATRAHDRAHGKTPAKKARQARAQLVAISRPAIRRLLA